MNENNTYQEIDLFDMVRALLKKGKRILCITLAALIVGASLGVLVAALANNSFGTTAEFYIYSDKGNNHILSLIQSDSFAENLLLNEYGLPDEYKDTEDYKKAYDIKVQMLKLEEDLELLEEAVEEFPRLVSDAQKASSETQTSYNEIYNMLSMYKSADANTITQDGMAAHNRKIEELEVKLEEARIAKDNAKKTYNEVLSQQEDAKEAVTDAEKAIKKLAKEFDKSSQIILAKFRAQDDNNYKIQKIKESVTYEYAESEDNTSQALLLVSIAVDNKEFAEFLLKQISSKLPTFVEEDTLASQTPDCEYISTFSTVERIEAKGLVSSAVKYGILACGGAFVITCCVVLMVHAFQKKKKAVEAMEASEQNA